MTTRPGPRPVDDEQGAVAIVVAVCLVVLLGLSSFAVDFGLAYSESRQVQTGVDAAALASAAAYAEVPGSCPQILATAGYELGVNAGQDVFQQNHPSVDVVADIRCEGSELRAGWTATVTTETSLARAMPGARTQIQSTRKAEAALGIPGALGSGVRPYMLCAADAPASDEPMPTQVRSTTVVDNGAPSDPAACPEPPGNWWTIDCPGDLPSQLGPAIAQGCTNPIGPSSAPMTFVDCPPTGDPIVPARCLSGDTGTPVSAASNFDPLIDDEVDFQLPVFGAVQGTGTNAEFTVLAVVTVQMCGYHLGNRIHPSSPPATGPCSAANTSLIDPPRDVTVGTNQEFFFNLVYKRVNYTDSITPSSCALGDPCDLGTRSVFLVQ